MLTNCSQHRVDPKTFPRSPPPPQFDLHINLITPPKCSQNCYSLLTTHADPDGLVEKAQPLHQLRLQNLPFTSTVPLQNAHQNTHRMLTTLADPNRLIRQKTQPLHHPSSSKFALLRHPTPPQLAHTKCSQHVHNFPLFRKPSVLGLFTKTSLSLSLCASFFLQICASQHPNENSSTAHKMQSLIGNRLFVGFVAKLVHWCHLVLSIIPG